MKTAAAILLATIASLEASPPVIIVRPAPAVTVVSPQTAATSATNQTLLNQVNGTITQRRFEHQILTTNAAVRAAEINAATAPRR